MLPDAVQRSIKTGNEQAKIELKEELDLSSASSKAKLAKSLAALANTPGDIGYVAIGVIDARKRSSPALHDCFKDARVSDTDAVQRQIQQILDSYVDPPVIVGYRQEEWRGSGLVISIVEVPISSVRPHVIKHDGDGIRVGEVYIRHNTMCVLASRQEILELCGDHWQAAYKGEIERLHDQLSECRENSVKLKMIGKELARKYRWLRRIDDRRARTVLKELLKNFELSELINEWLGEGEA